MTATTRPLAETLVPTRIASHWIHGVEVAATGRARQRRDPASGAVGTEVVCGTSAVAAAAVAAADEARPGWRSTPPAERAEMLRAAAHHVESFAAELGEALTAATGRPRHRSVASARTAAALLTEASHAVGRALPGPVAGIDLVRREPHGVVAVITPWNDPFPAAAGLLAAALVCGNTVVHKPSERSAVPGYLMARLIAGVLPDGVLNVVTGDGETGAALVADPRVHLVAHVGSSAVGRRIAAVVGARGGRVLLENGGKDPLLVDAGVDPQWAAAQIAEGAFTDSGQLCTAVERVYLHASVAEEVIAALVRRAEDLIVANPRHPDTELGPLVDDEQLAVVDAHVREAIAHGARCLTGGRRLDRPGAWYPPTVLVRCTERMAVFREETFGPVAPIATVPDFATALRRANTGRYGLAATVLTTDLDHALQAAAELEVGTVKINGVWGGAPGSSADPRRDSGAGTGYGPDLLVAMTVAKTVHLERAGG